MAPYNFSTAPHLVNLIQDIIAIGFENLQPIWHFVIHASVGYDCLKHGVENFFSDLDVSACAYGDIKHII